MAIVNNNQPSNELLTGKSIHGRGSFGGFAFSVDDKVPCIATAIHAGSHVRGELLRLMQIGVAERYFEADPETYTMIRGAASRIWGLDSRTEYDLNRPPQDAVPVTPRLEI